MNGEKLLSFYRSIKRLLIDSNTITKSIRQIRCHKRVCISSTEKTLGKKSPGEESSLKMPGLPGSLIPTVSPMSILKELKD